MKPVKDDYISWMQQPKEVFADQDFRDGVVDRGTAGPVFAAGTFAIVFSFKKNGRPDQRVALRCFDFSNVKSNAVASRHQKRYSALHRQLNRNPINAFVKFEFKERLFQLENGASFPALVMDWVEGQTLDEFVKQFRNNRKRIQQLASSWENLILELQTEQIAHNDLHHKNVMVVDDGGKDAIRLVDYDAVFLPSIQGLVPDELGHKNFQHPGRETTNHYGKNSDTFPALVIALSLHAIASDPALLDDGYHNDKNLIFKKEDFQTFSSPIWNRLKGSSDARVRALTDQLRELCKKDIDKLPLPSEALLLSPVSSAPVHSNRGSTKEESRPSKASWISRLEQAATIGGAVAAVALIAALMAYAGGGFLSSPSAVPSSSLVSTTASPAAWQLVGEYVGEFTSTSGDQRTVVLRLDQEGQQLRYVANLYNPLTAPISGEARYERTRGLLHFDDFPTVRLLRDSDGQVVLRSDSSRSVVISLRRQP